MTARSGYPNSEFLGWPAPAKLNLMLRIIGRRSDGYHLLQTVFQFVDRFDFIFFELRDDRGIRLTAPLPGVPESGDLCVRAAKLLQEESGCSKGVEIAVEKNLPMGGGLGGGSSDAATTLVGLNKLWGINWPASRLMKLGLILGADVPVFINGLAAWAEGIGDVLTPMQPPESWYVVLVPDCHVSTAKVFNSSLLTRKNEPVTLNGFNTGWHDNDCLDAVTKMCPPVKLALSDLSRFGDARLTGTGACVFACFETERRAAEAASFLSDRWTAFVCKGLNRSPLLDRLG